jgi:hypothetical protein
MNPLYSFLGIAIAVIGILVGILASYHDRFVSKINAENPTFYHLIGALSMLPIVVYLIIIITYVLEGLVK